MRAPVRPAHQARSEVSTRPGPDQAQVHVSEHRVSTQLSARLAERRRAMRRLRWRTIGVIAAVVTVLAALIYLVLFSAVLALRADQVQIHGAGEYVDTPAVREVIAAQDGVPLVRLDTSGIATGVEAVSGVLSAEVNRQWPHGLQVHLTAREAVAVVGDDEGYLILDAEAVQLDTTDEPRTDLPLVAIDVGSEAAAAALEAVVTVLGDLPPELFDEVTGAGAASADQVELELADGAVVIWGSAEEADLKAAVLQTLRQVPAEVYDVSAPRNPITRG